MHFKNVLISVSDTTGIAETALKLSQSGARIVATKGTSIYLQKKGIKVIPVSEQTGFPEVMNGRVRTLHPYIHIPLLARHNNQNDQKLLKSKNLQAFDLLICNLYPFEDAVQQGVTKDISEYIDIGGVTLLRAAAKNFESLVVICDTEDYALIFDQSRLSLQKRKYLSSKAFHHVSSYDAVIAQTLSMDFNRVFPYMSFSGQYQSSLRYGENPTQKGYWFKQRGESWGLHQAQILQGKTLSYNNILDINAAVRVLRIFKDQTTVVAVKHNNPCGIATDKDSLKALMLSLSADPVSVFGGIVALNGRVTPEIAEKLTSLFLECVITSKVEPEAYKILQKKRNLRVLVWKQMCDPRADLFSIKSVLGGWLLQSEDDVQAWSKQWQIVGQKPDEQIRKGITFAWKTAACLKSNAIAITNAKQTLGLGMGQTNRIDAANHAILRWKTHHPHKQENAILASDAFFPFTDVLERASQEGIKWIIQPGGSIKDAQIIQKAKKLGLNMILTGQRHFLH